MTRNFHNIFKPVIRVSVVLSVMALTGCVTSGLQNTWANLGKNTGASSTKSAQDDFITEPQMIAQKGIKLLMAGDLKQASKLFNLALKLDTTSSYLQFLNGLAYHLRALKGDSSLYPMAQQGYELAIKFDANNWLAKYHLGLLFMERRDYKSAREYFSEAALYKPDDPDVLYSLAVASYYAQDPVVAAGVLKHLREINPGGVRGLRASSLVMAALGKDQKAENFLSDLTKVDDNIKRVSFVSRRLKDWKNFHQRNNNLTKVQAVDVVPLYGGADAPYGGGTGASDSGYDPLALTEEEQAAQDQQDVLTDDYKMVIVDVVIIRTEEDLTTSKGVNLLNGLTLQFGTTDASNSGFSFKTSGSKVRGSKTSTITKAINIKSINYALNIANSNTARNEILARPTLVAMAGEQSDFFSGVEVDAAAVGGAASDGSTVSVQKEIGVKLALTPEFLDDGRIKLNVSAERTFLTTPNTTSVTFTLRVDTSKTSVNANVAMNFGETLILSGLSEKETERTRDGVPFLQDIPGLQYFFSKATTRDFQKSVLILITPRVPNYIFQTEKGKQKSREHMSKSERILNEFQARYSDWFKPYPNWASVFHHMQANQLYREFRTGDVALEKWASQSTLRDRLGLASEFIFY